MAGTPAPPDYDNIRWGGTPSTGLRVPQENGPATLALKKLVAINVGGAGSTNTVNLLANQTLGSEYVVTNAGSGATTIVWPGAFPGLLFVVYNNSGQALTLEVTGQTGIAGPVNGTRAFFVCEAANIARVSGDFLPGQQTTTYITAAGAIPLASGTYIINGAGALAMTLATPTTPAQDGVTLTIIAETAHAHTVTTAANKIVPSKDTVTYAAQGDYIILQSAGGLWYNLGLGGPTPAALSEV